MHGFARIDVIGADLVSFVVSLVSDDKEDRGLIRPEGI